MTSMTETELTAALREQYSQQGGNGQRYAYAAQVRSHAGFDARRTADFVAMDLWPSKRLALHGHEVKVSRGDWLRELKDPSKAQEFIPYMNHWWVVVPDAGIVRDGELPAGWGLMAVRDGKLAAIRKAPWLDALPMPATRMAALLRAVAEDARNNRPAGRSLEQATAEELRDSLIRARAEMDKLSAKSDAAAHEAEAWRNAYAATAGLPCARCGRPVRPRLRRGYVSEWKHVKRADEDACDGSRGWPGVHPADDLEPPKAS